jgi:hypothetical protein
MAMSRVVRAIALGLSVSIGSCAIHPLPEDFSGVSTYHIVRQIRCEARQAVIHTALSWLTTQTYDLDAQRIGREFADNARPIETFNYTLFKGEVRSLIQLFYDTGIAYTFTLKMTEQANVNTTIDLLKAFRNSTLTGPVGGAFNRQRQNLRTFTSTDTFSNLIKNVPESYCENFIRIENRVYPIAGRVGVEREIQDFINLTLFAGLASDPAKNASGPPTMADALDFQTTFSLSATPKLTFSPKGLNLSVVDASIGASVSRTDDHQVVIGLALPTAVSKKDLAPLRTSLFTGLVTPPAQGTGTERAAAVANDQLLTRTLFQQTIIVNQ